MTQCSECGYIHPPTSGGCPVKKADNRSKTEKGRCINDIIKYITEHLEKSEDWKAEINKFKRIIGR